jgi:NDP-sugar pyrophosphorylase family protein
MYSYRNERPLIGYINAGGRGTRLKGLLTADPQKGIAKALIELGEPKIKLLDHHIANLRLQGIDDIVVAAGDQSVVAEYTRDEYSKDRAIMVTTSEVQLGTGGDLVRFAQSLDASRGLVVQNVDTILDINIPNFHDVFLLQQKIGAIVSIALTKKRGVPNEDAYSVNHQGRVLVSNEFEQPEPENFATEVCYKASSTGAVIVDSEFIGSLEWMMDGGVLSLYKDCLARACCLRGLFAYDNGNRFFRDVGTIASWKVSQGDVDLQKQLRYNH